ncbi:F-box domain-containing protein [Phlyctema vagabunda]|uniref:F-box domain-containing protein n=1 Tax=Phlyctema vagabunda TaxID=108571 RepID=A0ABR4P3H5_9HELO
MTIGDASRLLKCSSEGVAPISKVGEFEEPVSPNLSIESHEELPVDELHENRGVSITSSGDIPSSNSTGDKCLDSLNAKTGIIAKGKGKEVRRGRTLGRSQRREDPLARATSRVRGREASIELDTRPIEKRFSRSNTFFDDPADPRAILEDTLLEPLSDNSMQSSISSLSEKLHSHVSTPDIGSSDQKFPALLRAQTSPNVSSNSSSLLNVEQSFASLQTVFNDQRTLHPVPTMLPEKLYQIMPDLDHLEYVAIKSSTSHWALDSVPQIPELEDSLSLAVQLPPEILHQIYLQLGPIDFNAARHICQNWFINSLERSLLETMLERGGWFRSIQDDIIAHNVTNGRVKFKTNDEWLMSKYISRECALGPDWTGNGFMKPGDSQEDVRQTPSKTSFSPISEIDFTEIDVHHPEVESSGIIFTVSSCGRFLMVANGCLIYVYELNQDSKEHDTRSGLHAGDLSPITSIICPRRVLACSMDTSSHRYAVAALMDGRMGLVCDITNRNVAYGTASYNRSESISPSYSSNQRTSSDLYREPSMMSRVSLNNSQPQAHTRASTLPTSVFPGIASTGIKRRSYSPATYDKSYEEVPRVQSTSQAQTPTPCADSFESAPGSSVPVEQGARSIYRNLCSDDDPPRSVAICPQRRCVAFGCSGGIELHWVDALTGQDLNRWFPLTAPSDYLFFLPPRQSVDSAKKLRLISSAAQPGERTAIGDRSYGKTSNTSPFWKKMGWSPGQGSQDHGNGIVSRIRRENTARPSADWRDYSDHYRAVPLSDGHHILFTDPETGLLCLGSDAPVGGPTKLLRKIWFQGPTEHVSPIAYAGGADLKRGARVVAAFGTGGEQSIWLFSVPVDVFTTNIDEAIRGMQWSRSLSDLEVTKTRWVAWWPDPSVQQWLHDMHNPVSGLVPRSLWPLKVRGQQIGTCPGLVDLAIHSGPEMIVWAFGKGGIAKVWQLDCGKQNLLQQRMISRHGTVREVDQNGDVEMLDVHSSTPSPDLLNQARDRKEESAVEALARPDEKEHNSYDGTTSLQTSMDMSVEPSDDSSGIEGPLVALESESAGEVLMEDLNRLQATPEDEGSRECFQGITMEPYNGEVLYNTTRWSGRSCRLGRTGGRDVVEELTGIARIDIEIR